MGYLIKRIVPLGALCVAILCPRAETADPKSPAKDGGQQPIATAKANEVSTEAAKPKSPKKKRNGFPFRGKLGGINKKTKTLTVAYKTKKRDFLLTSETRFLKNGKPAKLEDGVVGEEVAGYARKMPDGKARLVTVRFGPKPGSKTAKPTEAKTTASKS